MSLQQAVDPARASVDATATEPPVVLYLPGLTQSATAASQVADLMARNESSGPGTYTAEPVASPSAHLTDGRRITEIESETGAVCDLYLLDYRPGLQLSDVSGDTVRAAIRRFLLACWYFARVLVLVLLARRRAKSAVARTQLLIGLGFLIALLLSVVFTGLAVLAAIGLWTEPVGTGNVVDAIAVGFTAFTTALFFSARPVVRRATTLIEQLLEYAEDEAHAAGVARVLAEAIDDLLRSSPDRRVHLFGYSFGALVAMDYLHPRVSLMPALDERHAKSIASLVTVGCPVDFVRLYLPRYADDRIARVPGLPWTNVYIAADVFGSNFVEGDDFGEGDNLPVAPPAAAAAAPADAGPKRRLFRRRPPTALDIAGQRPVSHRYTSERLTFRNIWGRKGFLSHGGYWAGPERDNCLHLVLDAITTATPAPSPDSAEV